MFIDLGSNKIRERGFSGDDYCKFFCWFYGYGFVDFK